MNFLKYAKEHEQEMLDELFKLLRIDTVLVEQPEVKDAPFGPNLVKALNHMLDLGKKDGFKVGNVDNVAGYIEYGEGDEVIGVLCHLDVVPTGTGWTNPPFDPIIKDGKIYARGSNDDKGPLMASYFALKALKDNNIKLNKRVRLIMGTDEETNSRGVKHYLEVEKMPDLGFSPDADYPLIYGEKGILSFTINSNNVNPEIISFNSGDRFNVVPESASCTLKHDYKEEYNDFLTKHNYKGEVKDNTYIMYGKRAHAMEPRNGENALLRLCEFLNTILKDNLVEFITKNFSSSRLSSMNENFTDPEMGDLTSNVATMKVENGTGEIGINFRYPINWDRDNFFNRLNKKAKESNLEINIISDSEPLYVSKEDDLVKTLHKSYIKYTGDDKTPLHTIGGGTYARSLKRAVAFGALMPGRVEVAHEVDEYQYIEDLVISIAIYADAIKELGNLK